MVRYDAMRCDKLSFCRSFKCWTPLFAALFVCAVEVFVHCCCCCCCCWHRWERSTGSARYVASASTEFYGGTCTPGRSSLRSIPTVLLVLVLVPCKLMAPVDLCGVCYNVVDFLLFFKMQRVRPIWNNFTRSRTCEGFVTKKRED